MARLECHIGVSIGREDLEDYVRAVRVDVLQFNDDVTEEYLIGQVFMDQILQSEAEVDDVPLSAICDNESQGLHDAYSILTNGGSGFREDLEIDDLVQYIIFLHRFVLHPDFARYRQAVLESAVTLFGMDSLAVMWISEGGVTERELGQSGFRKISGEQLVFRHLSLQTRYCDEFPREQPLEAPATPEHHSWVLAQTKSDHVDRTTLDA